jgi:predicted membrane protein (TIGR00267 family)
MAKLLKKMKRNLDSWRVSLSKPNVREIASRYFVMNAFDGAMSMLGIIVGATGAGKDVNPRIIISAGLGAALAWAISGAVGAFMAERAERMRRLRELEESMLTDLNSSHLYRDSVRAILFLAIVDAIAPGLMSIFILVPFYLTLWNMISITNAITSSIVITLILLFGLGILLGKISKENIMFHGMITVVAGIITYIFVSLIPL